MISESEMKPPFGVSLAYGPASAKFADILDFVSDSVFSGIEISGTESDLKFFPGHFAKYGSTRILNVRNLFDSSTSSMVPELSDKLKDEFLMNFKKMLSRMAPLKPERITFSPGVQTCAENPFFEPPRVEFIKLLAAFLQRTDTDIVIPLRIPGHGNCSPDFFISFMRKARCRNISLSLVIFAHEMPRDGDPDSILSELKFNSGIVRFAYEPEAGNILVEKTLGMWFDALGRILYNGPVVFCPRISDPGHFLRELKRLAEIIEKRSDASGDTK